MIASATLTERRSWWPLGAILTAVLLQSCLPARATFASDFGDDSEAAATGSDEGAIHQDQYREVKERPARFEIEAEAFTSRNSGSAQGDWVKVASKTNLIQDCGRDGEAAATTPGDARRGTYILAVGKNAAGVPGSAEYDGPTVDYKVNVITPGTYRLYLRWAGKDDNTDSVYAMLIAEKGDSPKGPEFFLYHGRSLKYYDGWVWDWSGLKEQTRCAFAGRGEVAEWEIARPGVYTIRLGCREQGTAVDSLVFQTKDLRSPGNPRDGMRVKPGMRRVIKRAELIRVVGSLPKMENQHPLVVGKTVKEGFQGSLDLVEDGKRTRQIIVVYPNNMRRPEDEGRLIEIKGKLHLFRAGKPPGDLHKKAFDCEVIEVLEWEYRE